MFNQSFLLVKDIYLIEFFFSIGITNDMDNKLSTHRSDYEIHTPENIITARRPQSTAELVSKHNLFFIHRFHQIQTH